MLKRIDIMLIALDGLDGSGKETQTKLLLKELDALGIPYRYISFPTYNADWSRLLSMYLNGAFGDNPDSVNAYAASSFFAADRYCSFITDWKADYDAGKAIVCNRYTTANAVHQLSKLPEEEWGAFLKWLYDYEFGKLGLPAPDITVYLCVPPDIASRYIQSRAQSDSSRAPDIHEKNTAYLGASYRAALFSAKKLGWLTVDCTENGDMKTREAIHGEIIGKLLPRIRGILPEV